MKIVSKSITHNCIGESYEHIEVKWWFQFDEQAFDDPIIYEKFKYADVCQREYKDELLTWFKGTRTNTFHNDVKDKRKQKFIEIVNKFLIDNDKPLDSIYNPAQTTK
jgi:hypothetical protein